MYINVGTSVNQGRYDCISRKIRVYIKVDTSVNQDKCECILRR